MNTEDGTLVDVCVTSTNGSWEKVRAELVAENRRLQELFQEAAALVRESKSALYRAGDFDVVTRKWVLDPALEAEYQGHVDALMRVGRDRLDVMNELFREDPLALAAGMKRLATQLDDSEINASSLVEEAARLRLHNLPADPGARIAALLEAGSDLENTSPKIAIDSYEQAIALSRQGGEALKPHLIKSIRKLLEFLDFLSYPQTDDDQYAEDETLQLLERIRLEQLDALGITEDEIVVPVELRKELDALTGRKDPADFKGFQDFASDDYSLIEEGKTGEGKEMTVSLEQTISDLEREVMFLITEAPASGPERLAALIALDSDKRYESHPSVRGPLVTELDDWQRFLPAEPAPRILALSELFLDAAYGYQNELWSHRLLDGLHDETRSAALPDSPEIATALVRCFAGQMPDQIGPDDANIEYLDKVRPIYTAGLEMALRVMPAESEELAIMLEYFLIFVYESTLSDPNDSRDWLVTGLTTSAVDDPEANLSRNVVEYFESRLGRDHLNTITAMHLSALAAQDDAERVRLLIEVAEFYLKTFGPDDKRLLDCLGDIATVVRAGEFVDLTPPEALLRGISAEFLATEEPANQSLEAILATMEPRWSDRPYDVSHALVNTLSIYEDLVRWGANFKRTS